MGKRNLVSLMLAVLLILPLAACGTTQSTGTTEPVQSTAAANTTAAATPVPSETQQPVQLVIAWNEAWANTSTSAN